MLIDQLVKPVAEITYQMIKKREKQIGFALKLHNLSPHWIDGEVIYDMTSIWQKAGLNAAGVNYYTIGSIQNNLSTRFDPQSPYYQAWLGGYIVQFPNAHEWTLDDHYKLAEADQRNWLKFYGDKLPAVKMEKENVKVIGTIKIGEYTGKMYQGGGWSDTDVGYRNSNFPLPFLMAGAAYYYGKNNPHLKLSCRNFTPKWHNSSQLSSYQKIYLEGYIAIIEITSTTKVILYGNGAIFTDKNGKEHNTFKEIQSELRALIKSIEITKL